MDLETTEIGIVRALYRYPVKSMQGEQLEEASVGWYGLEGDRRYAFVRSENYSGFPWLTGREVPQMIRYLPYFTDPSDVSTSEVSVKTPHGGEMLVTSSQLCAELAEAHRGPVHLLRMTRGIFDSMPISIISVNALRTMGERIGLALDVRRFRPNILVETFDGEPFPEDSWLGELLIFGYKPNGVRIRFNRENKRCMMVNLDPETARQDPRVLKEIVGKRENCAGIYGSTEKPGTIRVGDAIRVAVR